MNFFDHKDLGNQLLQLCPKVVKHPVYILQDDTQSIQYQDLYLIALEYFLAYCETKQV